MNSGQRQQVLFLWLAEPTLNSRVLPHRRLPRWLIADLAYDTDPLRARLAARE